MKGRRRSKSDYVRERASEPQARPHTCHWPGCAEQVPPALWGCHAHWGRLPAALRRRIWAAYRPGQEIDQRPSADYVAVARQVQEWILRHEGAPLPVKDDRIAEPPRPVVDWSRGTARGVFLGAPGMAPEAAVSVCRRQLQADHARIRPRRAPHETA